MTVKIRVQNFQSIEDAEIEVSGLTVITGANNGGKALRDGTLVATPTGWVSVEAIRQGDQVVAGDGSPTEVLGVYPQGLRQTYRVGFDDGRELEVDASHLWDVIIGGRRFPRNGKPSTAHPRGCAQRWETLTTAEILQRVGPAPKGTQRPAIPSAGPASYNPRETPLDPYLLGVLLGDGHICPQKVSLSTADAEILESIRSVLPDGIQATVDGPQGYRLSRPKKEMKGRSGDDSNPVLTICRNLGVSVGSHLKFIPDTYKYNAVGVRVAILQGLMDTDGSASKSGGSYFYTTSDRLASDVEELVWSLGGKVRRRLKKAPKFRYKGELKVGKPCHILCIRLLGFNLFRLTRKLQRVSIPKRRNEPLIVSILPGSMQECTCIRVAHPSGLFQAAGHIVTHNSALHRAVYGAVTNARGTKFVRYGKDQCTVTLDFGDGHKLVWEKGEKVNSYTVDGKRFNKVGAGAPPAEVASLGIAPIDAAGKELWPQFAHQFTGQVFLLDQPGSVLAESIADVTRVGVLNEALRDTQSDRRNQGAELKVRRMDLAKMEALESSYAGLDTVDVLVREAAHLDRAVEDNREMLSSTTAFRDGIETYTDAVGDLLPVRWTELPNEVGDLQTGLTLLMEVQGLATKLLEARSLQTLLAPVTGISLPEEASVVRAGKVAAAIALLHSMRDQMAPLSAIVREGGHIREALATADLDTGDHQGQHQTLEVYRQLQRELTTKSRLVRDLTSESRSLEREYEESIHSVRDLLGSGECPICGRC